MTSTNTSSPCPRAEHGRWPDLMIDIETLGVGMNALVLSVAAVCFDRDSRDIGPTFHAHIGAGSAQRNGAVIDASTVLWWLGRSTQARQAILTGQNCTLRTEKEVLRDVCRFTSEFVIEDRVRVWALPPSFDLRILHDMADRNNFPLPWRHRNERCLRTAADDARAENVPRVNSDLAHDALADATAQAMWLQEIMAARRGA